MQKNEIFDKEYGVGDATEAPPKAAASETTGHNVDAAVQIYGTGKVKLTTKKYKLADEQDTD